MSKFFALSGLLVFALSLLGVLRLPLLAKYLGGYTSQFRIHHKIGLLAALLIILHVGSELLPGWPSNFNILIDLTDPGLASAWIAMLTLAIGFVALALLRLSHRIWFGFHMLFALSFVSALVHAVLFVTPEPLHETIVSISALLGVGSLVFLAIAKFWNPHHALFKVAAIRSMDCNLWELSLEQLAARTPIAYKSGQIVLVQFQSGEMSRQWHPFSVASCRTEPYLRLIVKALGHDTQLVSTLTDGTRVKIWGPFHEFSATDAQSQVWIAGGVGIAPFLGYLHCLTMKNFGQVRVIHFVSQPEEAHLEQLIQQENTNHSDIQGRSIVTLPGKLPDLDHVDNMARDLDKPRYLVCGPPPFMKMVRKHLIERGVRKDHIATEEMFR